MEVLRFPERPAEDRFPDFFAAAPVLRLCDPLARFLGTTPDGVMTYRYVDAVRLAGHSCPAVAGAWLMLVQGLGWLYEDELPERGGVEVHMRGGRDEGTTGVIAAIATLLTGAAPETGFQGIGPARRFARKDLLAFEAPIDGTLGLRRRDTGQGVVVDVNTAAVPHGAEMQALMPLAVAGRADDAQLSRFGTLWQDRVRRMLVEHADDPKLVHVYEWAER
jgi:hypothetical protein